jgi:hypothetical protein
VFVRNLEAYDKYASSDETFSSELVANLSEQANQLTVNFIDNRASFPETCVPNDVYVVRSQPTSSSPWWKDFLAKFGYFLYFVLLILFLFLYYIRPTHIVIDRNDPTPYQNVLRLLAAFEYCDCLYITETVESAYNDLSKSVAHNHTEFCVTFLLLVSPWHYTSSKRISLSSSKDSRVRFP